MEITLHYCPANTALKIGGDLRLHGREADRERLLRAFRMKNRPAELVVYLDEVAHLDSAGIAALVQALDECFRRGTAVQGVLPLGSIGQALRMVRLFQRYPQAMLQYRAAAA